MQSNRQLLQQLARAEVALLTPEQLAVADLELELWWVGREGPIVRSGAGAVRALQTAL
jgi:hypothetical protein